MQTYVLRRLALVVPTLIGVTVVVFALVRFLPGDAVKQILGDNPGYASDEAALRHELGLDRSIPAQYASWVGRLVRLDLGESLQSKRSIAGELKSRVPVTAELGVMAIILSLVIAVPVGVLSAVKQDTAIDYVVRGISVAMIAIPSFWLATLVITLPSIWWKWTPSPTYTRFLDNPIANVKHLIIPAIILAIALSGAVMRLTRATVLETLRQDYVRTARAKGLASRVVIGRHVLRNALIPVVTLVGLQVPVLIGGTVILENIFTIPGTGRYLLEGISRRDYPVIQAVNILIATTIVLTNIIVDLSYSLLDPRIRYH